MLITQPSWAAVRFRRKMENTSWVGSPTEPVKTSRAPEPAEAAAFSSAVDDARTRALLTGDEPFRQLPLLGSQTRSPLMIRSSTRAFALACGICLTLLASCQPSSDERAESGARLSGRGAGRNVILISLDTVRADRLGAWGHRLRGAGPSPYIDALIRQGVRFERAHAPRALTWPSLASVLTGLYPSGHGVAENGYELPEDLPTLATILQGRGYQTGKFLSNMCTERDAGWDVTSCLASQDRKIRPLALEWLDGLDRDRPFFLWVHYFGAHSPYRSRAGRGRDRGYGGPVAPRRKRLDRIMIDEIPLDDDDRRRLNALYDAAVMGTDQLVGTLVDSLDARGLIDTSVIVFLSDHGEDLYDHNRYLYHACSVYQSSLHVPLAIIAPGLLPKGSTFLENVELIDVAPTILDLLDVDLAIARHGVSLVPYLEKPGSGDAERPAFSEYGITRIRTVVDGDWKLIDNPDEHSPSCVPDAPQGHYPIAKVELFRLADDPLEQVNLADQYPEKVRELRALIDQRFAGLASRVVPQQLSEELKDALEALGYVAH
jgi:arylsulfatase A-like enzyme